VTAPTARAELAARGQAATSVAFRVSARSGSRTVSVPDAGQGVSLTYYVTNGMPTVQVPPVQFGDVTPGRVVLYLPWGSGAGQAGLSAGVEADTLGPSSFDVDGSGRVVVADPVLGRVSLYAGGQLVRDTRFPMGVRSDVAFASDGRAFVASSPLLGGRLVLVRTIDPSGRPGPFSAVGLADDKPSELRTAGTAGYLHLLPEDGWIPLGGGGTLTAGRPLAGGAQLLKVVDGNVVRLGTVVDGQVTHAVELAFEQGIGEIGLAELDGHGGYWAVVHVGQDAPTPADQYEVIHVGADLHVSAFAVANDDYSDHVPLSKFRLGQDGALYAMQSSPDGIRIVRYDLGGAR
jgi:hypothetical protein